MDENNVIFFIEKYFANNDYKIKKEVNIHGFRVDILAQKSNVKYFVECKGDSYLRSHEIHVMIGQTVSKMHETGLNIHYCLAMPDSLATYLREFSVEGIQALKLHLLVVSTSEWLNGEVFHLDTEGIVSFINELKRAPKSTPLSLFKLYKRQI